MSDYHKNTFVVTVLSKGPILNCDLDLLAHDVTYGDLVLHSTLHQAVVVGEGEMAELLVEAGSEPGFFGIEDPS